MTISATYTPAQASGNGVTVAFPFTFKTFEQADLVVIITDADDVDTTQTITTHYTVSLNADQNNNPGGTVTMVTAPASGTTLTIAREIDALQETDIANGGGFYPEVLEDSLDRLTMLSQQNSDAIDRSFTLPVTVAGVSTELPVPAANAIVGWNATADALQNYDPSVFATVVSFGTAKADIFDGDGVTLNFTLTANPGAQNNLDVSISGVTQTPGIDYTWTAGTTISFVVAPPSGTDNVLVRYMQGLANTNAQDATYTPSGTSAVETTIKTKLRESVSVMDFAAAGDGTTDDTAAIQAAIDHLATVSGGVLHFPQGDYKITTTLNIIAGNIMLMGRGGDNSHDVGTIGAQAATTLKWGGAAGGTMIKFSSPTGASVQKQNGGGVSGFYLDSNYNTNGAGIGIHLESWNSAEIKDVFGREFATAILKIDALAAGSLGDALDSQQNRIIGLTGRQLLAGGRFIMLDGNATASANASMNYFENCDVVFQGMAASQGAYDLLDCDNNVFVRCRAYAAAADDAIMFHAAADVGTARDNVFINFSTNSNGAIQCNGTAEAANPSTNNKFIAPDTSNGAGNPTMGTGATVHYDKSGTFTPTIAFGGDNTGPTYTTQLGTYTRIGNRVFFDIYVVLSSKGTDAGAVAFFTLPYTSANNGIFSAVSIRAGALAASATSEITGYIQPNTAGVVINKFAAGVVSDLLDTDVTNTSSFVISGSYQAA